jgi:hypothetical protein
VDVFICRLQAQGLAVLRNRAVQIAFRASRFVITETPRWRAAAVSCPLSSSTLPVCSLNFPDVKQALLPVSWPLAVLPPAQAGVPVLPQLPRSKGFFGQFRKVMLLFSALVPFQA